MTVTIRVFDPAMCCPSGVCGPSLDPELVRFAADLDWLKQQGVSVERFNLSQQPAAFAESAAVKQALARGTDVLPLVLVDERIAVEGKYPSRETLAALAGITLRKLDVAPAPSGGCCGGKSTDDKAAVDKGTGPKTSCC